MSLYTIGDRVEVLSGGKAFAATVIRVHKMEGACDAVYEIDNSVGVFLTPKEHGLKLLLDEPGETASSGNGGGNHGDRRVWAPTQPSHLGKGGNTDVALDEEVDNAERKKIYSQEWGLCTGGLLVQTGCSAFGCSANAARKGLCVVHGNATKCNMYGCTNNARARGLCSKHGSKMVCPSEGCAANSSSGGVCHLHGARNPSSNVGCAGTPIPRGIGESFGAKLFCSAEEMRNSLAPKGAEHVLSQRDNAGNAYGVAKNLTYTYKPVQHTLKTNGQAKSRTRIRKVGKYPKEVLLLKGQFRFAYCTSNKLTKEEGAELLKLSRAYMSKLRMQKTRAKIPSRRSLGIDKRIGSATNNKGNRPRKIQTASPPTAEGLALRPPAEGIPALA